MTLRTIGTGIVLVAVVATSAACDPMREARQSIASGVAETSTLIDRARVPTPPVDRRTVTFSDQVWLGQRSFIDRSGDALPARFEGDDGFLLATFGAPLTIDDLANEVRTQTGINVVVEQGTIDDEDEAPAAFPIDYEGPLSDFLDSISTSFGASWDYRRGRITLYLEETQTFEVTALPTESEVTQTSTAETTGDAGVSTSFSSSQTASTAAWADLEASLVTLVNERGSVSVAPAFGTVTVTTLPNVMRRVEEFMETLNRRALRQVALTIKLVEVELLDGDVTNVDLQLAFQRAASLVTPGVVATDPLITTTNLGQVVTAGTAAAPTFNTTGDLSFIINGNNRFSGTELGLQTLRQLGEASLVNEASVSTLSGRAVPVNVVFQQSYVAEVSVTTEEGVTTTEVEVENATDGININVLPSVLNDGRVLTQVAVSLRGEPNFINVGQPGGSTVQLLQQDLRDFQQQIVLNSGDAFVAAGFRAVDNSFNQRGFPGLGLLLGGTQSGINQDTLIALVISPQVLSQRRVAQR